MREKKGRPLIAGGKDKGALADLFWVSFAMVDTVKLYGWRAWKISRNFIKRVFRIDRG